jgi:hypothetical protein
LSGLQSNKGDVLGVIDQEWLTEQERVAAVATMYAISRAVVDNEMREVLDIAAGIELESIDLSKLLDIEIEVVNAALENMQDDGKVSIESKEALEDHDE